MTFFKNIYFYDESLPKRESFCDSLVYLLILALLLSCSIFGPARFIVIHGITPRMAVWGGIMLFSLPLIYRNWKKLIKSPLLIIWCIFFVYMTICAVYGYVSDNNYVVLISDIRGFLYFLMLPAFICVFRNRQRIEMGMRIVMIGSAILSLIICVSELIHILDSSFYQWLSTFAQYKFFLANYVSPEILRLFSSSTPYLVASICFCFYFQCVEQKVKWYYVGALALFLLAILLSFTRSVFLACGISMLIAAILILVAGYGRIFVKQLLFTVVVVALLLCGAYIAFGVNYIGFAMDRTLGTSVMLDEDHKADNDAATGNDQANNTENIDDIMDQINDPGAYIDTSKNPNAQIDAYLDYSKIVSDAFREYTISAMFEKIKASPAFGNGLGATIKYRDLNEFFYLDIMMKMGVFGLLLYISPALICGYWFIRRLKYLRKESTYRVETLMTGLISCGFLGICVFSFFNPYLNAVLGETMYSFGIAAIFVLKDRVNISKRQVEVEKV